MELKHTILPSRDEFITPAVVIYGGMHSVNEFSCSAVFYVYYPLLRLWSREQSPSSGLGADDLNGSTAADDSSAVHRFGHTLTNIGYKTLMLAGGANFDESDGGKMPIVLFDFEMTSRGSIEMHRRFESSMESRASVPCGACRVHHQALYRNVKNGPQQVILTGGGATCLAFGSHFCESLVIDLSLTSKAAISSSSSIHEVKAAHLEEGVTKVRAIIGNHEKSFHVPVVLVAKNSVKTFKNLLEQNGWIEKSVRITSYDCSSDAPCITKVPLGGEAVPCEPLDYHANMVVPISISFSTKLTERSLTAEEISSLKIALSSDTLYLTSQACPRTKAESLSPYALLSVFLDTFSARWRIPRSSFDEKGAMAPINGGRLKLEVVGDVLMISEDVLCVEPWVLLDGSEDEKQMRAELWLGLATCFGTVRVARKARIDSGPKRESR
jgi:hypothetical protein